MHYSYFACALKYSTLKYLLKICISYMHFSGLTSHELFAFIHDHTSWICIHACAFMYLAMHMYLCKLLLMYIFCRNPTHNYNIPLSAESLLMWFPSSMNVPENNYSFLADRTTNVMNNQSMSKLRISVYILIAIHNSYSFIHSTKFEVGKWPAIHQIYSANLFFTMSLKVFSCQN